MNWAISCATRAAASFGCSKMTTGMCSHLDVSKEEDDAS
jgi:hypothetical protein